MVGSSLGASSADHRKYKVHKRKNLTTTPHTTSQVSMGRPTGKDGAAAAAFTSLTTKTTDAQASAATGCSRAYAALDQMVSMVHVQAGRLGSTTLVHNAGSTGSGHAVAMFLRLTR